MNAKGKAGGRPKRTASPTLVDVAREAGTSVSTAGRVLRDGGWPVDAALKDRVRRAAAHLRYVPNMLARTLRAGAPALVGLVAGNMLDPYYGEIAEAITRHAEAEHKMLAMVCNMQRDPELELKYCRQLWEHRVAGLILAGGGFDQITHQVTFNATLKQMMRSGIAITTLSPRRAGIPQFCVDNERVGRMAATALLAHGHRQIGIVIGQILNEVRRQRLHSMIATLRAAGAAYRIVVPEQAPEPQLAVAEMLDSHPAITAIIASSHMISLGIINGVRQAGRSVPEDISVVGIGNPKLAGWTMPKLTYIDLRLEACGRAALDHIAARVSGKTLAENDPPEPLLVQGESVRAIEPVSRPRGGRRGGSNPAAAPMKTSP